MDECTCWDYENETVTEHVGYCPLAESAKPARKTPIFPERVTCPVCTSKVLPDNFNGHYCNVCNGRKP